MTRHRGRFSAAVMRGSARRALVYCPALAAFAAVVAMEPTLAQTIRIPDFRQQAAVFQPRPGEPCVDCGRIASVREIPVERRAKVPASFQGDSRAPADYNLVGAVVYLPLARGSGDRPFIGGVGTPEMRERFGETTYEVTVRMDDASTRFVERRDGSRFRVGDRVRSVAPGELDLVFE
jgi:hypothetical protein